MDRINEMLDRLAELSDEEIAELSGLIVTEFEALEAQEQHTNETVDQMTSLATALENVRGETTKREEHQAELAARAAEASAKVHGAGDDETPAEAEGESQPAEASAETAEPVAAAAEAEAPEPAPAPEAPKAAEETPAAPVVADAGQEASPPANSPAPGDGSEDNAGEQVAPAAPAQTAPPAADQPVAPDQVPNDGPVTDNDGDGTADNQQVPNDQNNGNTDPNQEAPVTAAVNGQEVVIQAPEDAQPVPRPSAAVAITAGADIPGMAIGTSLKDEDAIAEAFTKRLHSMRNAVGGDGEQSIVASIALDYPDDRILSSSDATANWEKIEAVVSQQAITAAGGYCAPLEVRYDLFGMGSTVRPVKAALPSFRADRGGIRFVEPPVLANYGGAVGVWTAATDASPGTATKPCLTVTCGNELTALADAVTLCLQFGNLVTRAFPELVARNNELAAIQFARFAELRLLAKVKAAGTAVTVAADLSAIRDLLDQVSRAASSLRYRHRLGQEAPLRFMAPSWLRDALRSDLSKEMPGDSVGDQHALTDARIASWFAARNINVTWTLEGLPTFGGPVVGTTTAMSNWPTTVEWDLFPEGTFLFLDGGTLDLGIIRDSTLVSTNDYKMFMESFEGVAKLGPESLHVTSNLEVDGVAQALIDASA